MSILFRYLTIKTVAGSSRGLLPGPGTKAMIYGNVQMIEFKLLKGNAFIGLAIFSFMVLPDEEQPIKSVGQL